MVRLCSVWMVAIFPTVVAKKSWSHPPQRSSTSASRRLYRSLLSRTIGRRNAFPQASAAGRSLQVTSTTFPSTCLNASTVNFYDDDLYGAVFGSAYQGTCTCMEKDMDIADVLSTLPSLPDPTSATLDEIANYTAAFNEQYSKFESGHEFSCTSGCSTCFENDAYCGFLVSRDETSLSGQGSNFTFEDIITGQTIMLDVTLDAETCLTYETGETGQVCLRYEFSGADFTSEPLLKCTIRYNDVPCNSCENANSTTGCYRADCTNVVPDAILDGCAMTGFVGPFRFLQSEQNLSDVTLGTCKPSNTGGAASNGNASTTPTTNGSSSSTGTGGSVITKLSILFAIVAGLF